MTAPLTLTELREKVQEARYATDQAILNLAEGWSASECVETLDALLTAVRALCLAEAREAVYGEVPTNNAITEYEDGYNDGMFRALAALDALQEGK